MQQRKSQKSSGTSPRDQPDSVGTEKSLLVYWDDLPIFLRDNEYIHSGYQPQSNSYRKCIQGLTYLHNQTGNIYTQAFAASVLVSIGIFLLRNIDTHLPEASQEDIIVFGSFFLGLTTSLTLSFTFHTIANHSPEVHSFWLTFDFLGLLIAAAGGFVPGLWYTFYCTPRQTKIVMIMLQLCLQLATAYLTLSVPVFGTPPWRLTRAITFGLMGSLAYVPIITGIFVFGTEELILQGGNLYSIAAILYLACGCFYASRWPEKWRPGGFDIWGHSHQLFHIAGFIGMLFHLSGLLQAFAYHKELRRC